MKLRLLLVLLSISFVQANNSYGTDVLRLLAQVSHLQAESAAEDLDEVADKQKDLIAKKKELRELQEDYDQALVDHLNQQDPELGRQLQATLDRFQALDQEWDQAFGQTLALLLKAHRAQLDRAEPEEEEPMGITRGKIKKSAGEEEEEEMMPMRRWRATHLTLKRGN